MAGGRSAGQVPWVDAVHSDVAHSAASVLVNAGRRMVGMVRAEGCGGNHLGRGMLPESVVLAWALRRAVSHMSLSTADD